MGLRLFGLHLFGLALLQAVTWPAGMNVCHWDVTQSWTGISNFTSFFTLYGYG